MSGRFIYAGLNTGADEFSIFREHPAFKYGAPACPICTPTGGPMHPPPLCSRLHSFLALVTPLHTTPTGIPQTDSLRIFDGYVTSYDGRTRNPKWVLEVVTRESLQGGGTRCAVCRVCPANQTAIHIHLYRMQQQRWCALPAPFLDE
jgi:hypothetical protein